MVDDNRTNNSTCDKRVAMIRSCSEVTPRIDYTTWPGHLVHRNRSGTSNEIPLIGECRYCDQSCRCSCCPCCDHLVIIYAPCLLLASILLYMQLICEEFGSYSACIRECRGNEMNVKHWVLPEAKFHRAKKLV
uniref:Uncharacterized protein n=1 Tax=Elaeophora elaphi TaxID=1147741 RepID=A0A0R3RKG1_9BILA